VAIKLQKKYNQIRKPSKNHVSDFWPSVCQQYVPKKTERSDTIILGILGTLDS
jgi:hypothetical protein